MSNPYGGDGYPDQWAPTQRIGGEPQPYAQHAQQPPQTPPPGRQSPLDNGRFFAGVGATALVAAVIGWVGSLIIEALYKNHDFGAVWGPEPQSVGDSALYGFLAAIVAGLLLWLLVNVAPAAETFFYWVTGLLVFASVLLPFLNDTAWQSALCTAIVNAAMGLGIMSLLGTVASKTVRPGLR